MPREIVKLVYDLGEMIQGAGGAFSHAAVERAKQWAIEAVVDHEWWDYEVALWGQALNEIGFEDAEIQFSGFGCQGDGASFTANIDLEKLITFLSHPIEASESIAVLADGETDAPLGTAGEEYFSPWIVHQIGGKPEPAPKYSRLRWVMNVANPKVERSAHNYSHALTCRITDEGLWWLDDPRVPGNRYKRLSKLWMAFLSDAEDLRQDLCRAIYKTLEDGYYALVGDENLIEMCEINGWTFDHHGHRDGYHAEADYSRRLEPVEPEDAARTDSRKRKLLLGSSIHRTRRTRGR